MAADTVLIRLGGRLVTSTELDALIAAADAHPDLPYVDTITISSTPSDPEGAKVWDELQAERLRGMAMFAKALTEQGHLRPEVHATEARDVLWTYNSAELYQLLVIQRRWSAQRYGS
jgi:hypothetical protein